MRSNRATLATILLILGNTGTAFAAITTPHDTIPDFCESPTIRSVANGRWSSPSTWSPARVPAANDKVEVVSGTIVTFDQVMPAAAKCVGIHGSLDFSTTTSTRLWAGEVMVYADGSLYVGDQANPIPANLTAEIVIAGKGLNTTTDPKQFGTGLIVTGAIVMHGSVKTPTFVRTATEPRAGNTTIALAQSVTGWQVGDRIFLPDTRQVGENDKFNQNYVLQVEERTIQNISPDGRTITLSSALSFDHRGARDADGTPTVLSNGIKLLPHVGNLTRNIVIRSEDPSGTRGHTLFTHRADVDIRYTQFQNLGRTKPDALDSVSNHIGRYPLHMHHLWGPVNPSNTGYQFELVGNAINDSLKWPIAVHGSHFGHVYRNVIFGGSQHTGAGIAIEDGTETENLIEENFVANIRGNVNARNTGPSTEDGSTPGSGAECFWAAGFNTRFVNNVASDCRNPAQQIVAGPGFKLIVLPAPYNAQNPRFRGADMHDSSQTVTVTPQRQPILEFRGNEVYGGSAVGLTIWNLGTSGYDDVTVPETLIKDFRVWHTYEAAAWLYPVNHVTFDGPVYRVDPNGILYWEAAIQSGDYRNKNMTIRGGSIHAGGVFGGTEAPMDTVRIENVIAVTHGHAFTFPTPETPGTGAGIPDPPGITVIMQNNVISAWPGRPLQTISMDFQSTPASYPNVRYEIFVYDYQGNVGNNFKAYWHEQATQNIAGGLAPCNNTTTRPEVDGITCPTSGVPAQFTPPQNLKITN